MSGAKAMICKRDITVSLLIHQDKCDPSPINVCVHKKMRSLANGGTPSGAIVKQISSLPSDVHKTKKLSFDEYMNISKGHQILM